MRSFIAAAYSIVVYGIFLATFLYAIGFIGGFLTPTTLDIICDVYEILEDIDV